MTHTVENNDKRKTLAVRGASLREVAVWAVLTVVMLATGFSRASDYTYKVTQQWPLNGGGGWNSILADGNSHRLYIPRDTRISVLDTKTGVAIGEIAGLTDVHEIALDPNGKVGYISDGIAGAVHVFDCSTLKLMSSILVGGTVDSVLVEPYTRQVFAFNTHNNSVSVIDPSSYRVAATISLSARPAAAVSDGRGSVFVNLVSAGQLGRIDAKSLKLAATWQLSGCVGPSGISMDTAAERVFSVCENRKMVVSDINLGKVIATLPIGEGAKSVSFDRSRQLVFSSNGEGSLTIIRENTPNDFTVLQTLQTQPGTRTMSIDANTGLLYLVSARFGQRTGPTSEELQFRPSPVPGSVVVLVVSP